MRMLNVCGRDGAPAVVEWDVLTKLVAKAETVRLDRPGFGELRLKGASLRIHAD